MSHRIYTTEGFVLSRTEKGEASKILHLFTEKFGLVSVYAQGVCEIRSKLRIPLSSSPLLSFSLVRGKSMWRLTDVHEIGPYSYNEIPHEVSLLFAKISILLKRLCEEDSTVSELFHYIREGFQFLCRESFTPRELSAVEIILVLNILSFLGYMPRAEKPIPLQSLIVKVAKGHGWNKDILEEAGRFNRELVIIINETLAATHL